ncbi:hypothetical protein [Paractinoplanes rishiriensis]|uniref:Uncharacterized protein n=1 Tax=Paractinoplanes rishiriensis TaxID=1050105 RepID=A0A919K963_9ACTN|nr:hypothetical protein [Actinoplanes rishiriensis]GIF02045.1 hypothetical protein Ari01nite_95090 [Actinoplanes rishiriensis]
MFRPQSTARARWVVGAVALLALLGGGLVVALPAQAATAVTDSFEGNAYDRWTVAGVRGFSFVELQNHSRARTGINLARLGAYPSSEHAARMYRSVTVDNPGGCCGADCSGEAYVYRPRLALISPDGTITESRPEKPKVTLQIRAGGPSGPNISGSSYDLEPNMSDYGWAVFARFPYQAGPFTVDISVRSGDVFVDDVTVQCFRRIP